MSTTNNLRVSARYKGVLQRKNRGEGQVSSTVPMHIMSSEAKPRDMEVLSACLDELAAAETTLQRRAEILASLRERFDAIVSSQLSPAHAAVIVPALCEASASGPTPEEDAAFLAKNQFLICIHLFVDFELYPPHIGSRSDGSCEQAEEYSY